MAKYSFELKLEAVLAYLNGNESIRAFAQLFNVSRTPLEAWIAQYRVDVLNYMSEFGASFKQAAAVYNITSPSTVLQWQRQVEKSGVDALLPKKKGCPSMKK